MKHAIFKCDDIDLGSIKKSLQYEPFFVAKLENEQI